jgi:succinyl-CoA synthetase beta subunit
LKLHEYQAKEILDRYAVPTQRGRVTSDPAEARRIAEEFGGKAVVKAQVHMGGRGKAGGVKLVQTAEDAEKETREMLGKRLVSIQNPAGMVVEKVLVTELIDIAKEYYVAVTLDRAAQKDVVILSRKGGVDIEEVAHSDPAAIIRLHIDPAWGLDDFQVRNLLREAGIDEVDHRQLGALIKGLVKVYYGVDASMVEVNPCAVTPEGKVLAADAKVLIDDNALYRQKEFAALQDESADDPIEAEAHRRGIAYVRLGGHVGVIGNGAGLVMCTLDEVARAGGKASNFLDIGGGAQADQVRKSVELVLMDENVRGLLINIFGGITRCDEVAKGILEAMSSLSIRVPVVLRLEGTRAAEGLALLEGSKITGAATMQEAAQKIVALCA